VLTSGNSASQLSGYVISCPYVAIGISPSTVARGTFITVTGDVMSSTTGWQTVSVEFALTGPMG